MNYTLNLKKNGTYSANEHNEQDRGYEALECDHNSTGTWTFSHGMVSLSQEEGRAYALTGSWKVVPYGKVGVEGARLEKGDISLGAYGHKFITDCMRKHNVWMRKR